MERERFAAAGLAACMAALFLPHAAVGQAAHDSDEAVAIEEADDAADAAGEADIDAMLEEAQPLYIANCRMCHGTNGTAGVPLAGNERVYPEYVAAVIIEGPGYMPSLAVLEDDVIAAISNYVANSWGNDFGVIMAEDVAAFR